ncbi:MAG TPA: glycine cleavage system aminomethyltransferase GcvT [Nitrososphaeraceae archaeon]|nr:glycine cleavage system aminomethyltransferase GcvT [Nitrososphaeraceae archaeon]
MKTPFYDIHRSSGAKMLDFHGWKMPLHYSSGIIDEHINTRTNVSLFDVSHMGRFEVKGPDAYDCLQTLLTNDVSKLNNHQALYSTICYDNGRIIDDLIIYMINREKFLIVVNASNREKDLEWIIKHSNNSATVEDISDKIALLALQGPLAQNLLEKAAMVGIDLNQLKPFDLNITNIFGIECMISRTGYTGEDGFELFFDSSKIDIWDKLIQLGSPTSNIKPAGLGARDTLRLEAGLMLYGNDIDENTTPLEVPLKWTVKFEKKEFIGKKALTTQQINRKLVGFEVIEKRVARHGNEVLLNSQKVGFVTSGSFSPTLKKSIGFCFVPTYVLPNQLIEINIGGKLYKAKVLSSTRFYKRK